MQTVQARVETGGGGIDKRAPDDGGGRERISTYFAPDERSYKWENAEFIRGRGLPVSFYASDCSLCLDGFVGYPCARVIVSRLNKNLTTDSGASWGGRYLAFRMGTGVK